MKVVLASTQFDLRRLGSPEEFFERCERLIRKAKAGGAQVFQFPEYFTLSWLLSHYDQDFSKALDGFKAKGQEFHDRFARWSKDTGMVIAAGSVPVNWNGRRVNRCYVYLPNGQRLEQDKRNMTRFEDEEWGVASGQPDNPVFEFGGARFGVAICYDVEFPDYVRDLVLKDVDIVLVPSCTDDIHGYWRVRHCAEARAVEGQLYMAMSSIVGGDPAHPEIDAHYGRAGFFTPCDKDFPAEGLLSLGTLNAEDVHLETFDLEILKKVRQHGTVLNRRDTSRK